MFPNFRIWRLFPYFPPRIENILTIPFDSVSFLKTAALHRIMLLYPMRLMFGMFMWRYFSLSYIYLYIYLFHTITSYRLLFIVSIPVVKHIRVTALDVSTFWYINLSPMLPIFISIYFSVQLLPSHYQLPIFVYVDHIRSSFRIHCSPFLTFVLFGLLLLLPYNLYGRTVSSYVIFYVKQLLTTISDISFSSV